MTVKAGPAAQSDSAAATPATEQAADEEPGEYYTIKSGDTLSGIAREHYGNAMEYKKVFEANQEIIKDPDKIHSGQKIFIPKD